MEIKVFDEDFDHCLKILCRKTFVEQLFAEPLLVERLSIPMASSIKLKIT